MVLFDGGRWRTASADVGFAHVRSSSAFEIACRDTMITVEIPTIVPLTAGDWPAVRAIYEEGIETGQATFETRAPTWTEWDAAHLAAPRLVARLGGASNSELLLAPVGVVGWAALSPVSERCVYAGVAEDSVYVSEWARGHGVGNVLLRELVTRAERAGIWTVQAGIFPENAASLALHVRCGFRIVGVRERIGRLNGEWRDVLLLERRSQEV